jgi:transcriptional regulator with XRE-family HTH domain
MTDPITWTQWVRQTEASPEYAAEQAKLDFAVALERRMQQCDVHRAELARRLGTSGAAVTMALRGDANLTLDRMARMAHALDATVHVHVAPRESGVKWFELHSGSKSPQYTSAVTSTHLSGGDQYGKSSTIAA